MHFVSDNTGPVHPNVMEALSRANAGNALPYGADDLTRTAVARIREIFEAPEAEVFLVTTGSAANALSLAALARPWDAVFCSKLAHVQVDECNAPEFFTGGAKLRLVPSPHGLMTAEALEKTIEAVSGPDYPDFQRGPVSLTQLTERGTRYRVEEIAALTAVARHYGLSVHMDGARFANALVALGCSPADMSWKAGIDALSFGGTKNGLMSVEAIVFFDPAKARSLPFRRARGAHRLSKHRYLAAQMVAYLEDDLWLDMARTANEAGRRLADGLRAIPGVRMIHEPAANMIFAEWPRSGHQRLHAAGAEYDLKPERLEGPDEAAVAARLVCDWSCPHADVDRFVELVRG